MGPSKKCHFGSRTERAYRILRTDKWIGAFGNHKIFDLGRCSPGTFEIPTWHRRSYGTRESVAVSEEGLIGRVAIAKFVNVLKLEPLFLGPTNIVADVRFGSEADLGDGSHRGPLLAISGSLPGSKCHRLYVSNRPKETVASVVWPRFTEKALLPFPPGSRWSIRNGHWRYERNCSDSLMPKRVAYGIF
jgi:hypothetical protein